MLKSDSLIVAFQDETVVWRWRHPAPFEFLFLKRNAATFVTKAATMLKQWQVKAPHGALAIATTIVSAAKPTATLDNLVQSGVLLETTLETMPVWISETELDRMTLTDAQQALLGTDAPGAEQPFTLEI